MVQDSNPESPSLLPVPDQSRIDRRPTVRKLKEILVYEPELDHVSLLNSLTAFFSSAASASLAFIVGLATTAAMQDPLSEKAKGMLWIGIPGGIILTAGFTVAAVWALCTKGSETNKLKQGAVDIPQAYPAPVIPQSDPDVKGSTTGSTS